MQFSLKVEGIEDVKKDLKKYSDNVNKGLAREIARTTTNIHKDARQGAPVHTGNLRKLIQFSIRGLTGTVWSGSKYGIDVEQGSKPGKWAHVGDLMFWVKKKIKPPSNKLKSVTYLINRKIFLKGIEKQPYFEPAVKKHEKSFYNKVRDIIRKG